jgi:hypothetical protein
VQYALQFVENFEKELDKKYSRDIIVLWRDVMKNLVHKIITPKFISRTKYAKLVLVTVFILIGAFIGITYSSKKPSVDIGNGVLIVKSLFYGKSIPIGEININGNKYKRHTAIELES